MNNMPHQKDYAPTEPPAPLLQKKEQWTKRPQTSVRTVRVSE